MFVRLCYDRSFNKFIRKTIATDIAIAIATNNDVIAMAKLYVGYLYLGKNIE